MLKNVLILIVAFVFFSCKEKTKKASKENLPTIETVESKPLEKKRDNKIRLSFKGVFPKDDVFLVYYSTKENQRYSNQNFLKKKINKSDKLQNIELEFPENINIYDLRIDFSDNKNQKNIVFEELKISDSLNNIIINKNNIKANFNFDSEKVDFDKENSILSGKLFLTKQGVKGYNPFFNSNLNYRNALKLFNQSHSLKKRVEILQDAENIDLSDGEFRVIIEGTYKKDDVLLLFYTDDYNIPLKNKKPLKLNVKGSDFPQTFIFTLPNEDYLVDFRLDLSDNINQEKILIDRILIVELNSKIIIEKEELSQSFVDNEYIALDNQGLIRLSPLEDKGVKKYNPYFLLSKSLKDKLAKI